MRVVGRREDSTGGRGNERTTRTSEGRSRLIDDGKRRKEEKKKEKEKEKKKMKKTGAARTQQRPGTRRKIRLITADTDESNSQQTETERGRRDWLGRVRGCIVSVLMIRGRESDVSQQQYGTVMDYNTCITVTLPHRSYRWSYLIVIHTPISFTTSDGKE